MHAEGTAHRAPPALVGDEDTDVVVADQARVDLGPVRGHGEAVEILNKDGLSVKGLHLSQLWPFPGQHLLDNFKGIKRWGVVEGNYTGQLARLIQMEMQRKPNGLFLKYTGRPFLPEEIADSFRKEVIAR